MRTIVKKSGMLHIVIIVTLLSVGHAKSSYLILAPRQVQPGVNFDISVTILNASSDVTVKAKLVTTINSSFISQTLGTFKRGSTNQLSLHVPDFLEQACKLIITGTGGLSFKEETYISYRNRTVSLFIQTDKGIYKAGQTINFRVFALYTDLKVYYGPFNISMHDPKGNLIKQWRNVSHDSGVYTGSMVMTDNPVLGDWTIKTSSHEVSSNRTVMVDRYVLPKFEVTVHLPSFVLTNASQVQGIIEAKYSYGKPVSGNVEIEANLRYSYSLWNYQGSKAIIRLYNITIGSDGKARFVIPIRTSFGISTGQYLVVKANVTETLTDITFSSSEEVPFRDQAIKILFLPTTKTTFKPGLPYKIDAQLTDIDGTPITSYAQGILQITVFSNETITPQYYYDPTELSYKLNDIHLNVSTAGIISELINIPDNATKIRIKISFDNIAEDMEVRKYLSISNSFIQLNVLSKQIMTGDKADFSIQSTGPLSSVVVQLFVHGNILYSNIINGMQQKTINFSITISKNMGPECTVMAYFVRQDGEIVIDHALIHVDSIFGNQVSIRFNQSNAKPGDNVTISVAADPSSYIYMLVADESSSYLREGNDITEEQVISNLHFINDRRFDNRNYACVLLGLSFNIITDHDDIDNSHIQCPYCEDKISNCADYGYTVCIDPKYTAWTVENCQRTCFKCQIITRIQSFQGLDSYCRDRISNCKDFGQNVCYGAYKSWARDNCKGYCGFCMSLQHGTGATGAFIGSGTGISTGSGTGIGTATGGSITDNTHPLFKPVKRTRKRFPETWIWSSHLTGIDGHLNITAVLPDTITAWVASAFVVNKRSGFSLSNSAAKIVGFKDFFISLNLPYSVIRGEEVALQVNLFNYQNTNMSVLIVLKKNDDFQNVVKTVNGTQQLMFSKTQSENTFVLAGESTSVYFPIVPRSLGPIYIEVTAQSSEAADGIRRELLVEPEGVLQEYNTPVILQVNHSHPVQSNVSVPMPLSVVDGSQRIRVSVMGDFVVPTLHNLDRLIRLPTGCGEQTIVKLAPDVYVANYLKKSNQYYQEMKEKLTSYMEKGYQNELRYQRTDGSFSAFGNSDSHGNMWLSAYVIKTFQKAKTHIFIDDNVIIKSVKWIISHQLSDGSFPGSMYTYYMQDKTANEISLTAFVLIALQENLHLQGMTHSITDAVTKAQHYLETNIYTVNDIYCLAITSYALAIRNSSYFDAVFKKLGTHAVVIDDMKYWTYASSFTSNGNAWSSSYMQSISIDIETSAYALLAYTGRNLPLDGYHVMKWIITQRNSNGGFASSQDTVVALEAITEFGLFGSQHRDMLISITAGKFSKQFTIDSANALVLQTIELPKPYPQNVLIEATGEGNALAEVSVLYNIEQSHGTQAFHVSVNIDQETFVVLETNTCVKWLRQGRSGMAILEIGIPTGFQANHHKITHVPTLKKIEMENRKLILYFDKISSHPVCIKMKAVRTGLVAKTKPSVVRVYDYYKPELQFTTFYQSGVLQKSNICDICNQCKQCRQ
ncbi:CD109 antigen-like isoform X1 [Mytilus galloprovincialis]|uniref:CD109 antigen-like isoform X1 n=1 Tax=Mytilus galloprovincialis TaxID=29158 RepID=UPI003F7C2DD0